MTIEVFYFFSSLFITLCFPGFYSFCLDVSVYIQVAILTIIIVLEYHSFVVIFLFYYTLYFLIYSYSIFLISHIDLIKEATLGTWCLSFLISISSNSLFYYFTLSFFCLLYCFFPTIWAECLACLFHFFLFSDKCIWSCIFSCESFFFNLCLRIWPYRIFMVIQV